MSIRPVTLGLAVALGFLSSCAQPPRAVVPPPSVIRELNVAPVTASVEDTRTAVKGIGEAQGQVRDANVKLSDLSKRLTTEMDKQNTLAEANVDLQKALEGINRFATELVQTVEELTTARESADHKTAAALESADRSVNEALRLAGQVEAQKAEVRAAKVSEESMRGQLASIGNVQDKLAVAKDKLSWWKKVALVTWGAIATYLFIVFLLPLILKLKPL